MEITAGSMVEERWSGVVLRAVDAPVGKLWDLASDFCGLCKWMPMVEECRRIQGDDDRSPGCVRLVIGTSLPRQDGGKSWAKEKLVAMNSIDRSLTYVVVDGNIDGLDGYCATLKVSPSDQDPTKSLVEWKFEMRPSSKSSRENAVEFVQGVLGRYVTALVLAAQAAS